MTNPPVTEPTRTEPRTDSTSGRVKWTLSGPIRLVPDPQSGAIHIEYEAEATAPDAGRCDRIINNGMGEPTECGRTLPCEYHPTPAGPAVDDQ